MLIPVRSFVFFYNNLFKSYFTRCRDLQYFYVNLFMFYQLFNFFFLIKGVTLVAYTLTLEKHLTVVIIDYCSKNLLYPAKAVLCFKSFISNRTPTVGNNDHLSDTFVL